MPSEGSFADSGPRRPGEPACHCPCGVGASATLLSLALLDVSLGLSGPCAVPSGFILGVPLEGEGAEVLLTRSI